MSSAKTTATQIMEQYIRTCSLADRREDRMLDHMKKFQCMVPYSMHRQTAKSGQTVITQKQYHSHLEQPGLCITGFPTNQHKYKC